MEFWPIRCLVTERYKLAINLFDRDELYDLEEDPHELHNCIDEDPVRDELLDKLLAEMDRISDPMRGGVWAQRPWASPRSASRKQPPQSLGNPQTRRIIHMVPSLPRIAHKIAHLLRPFAFEIPFVFVRGRDDCVAKAALDMQMRRPIIRDMPSEKRLEGPAAKTGRCSPRSSSSCDSAGR